MLLTTSQVVGGNAGVYCRVDGGVAKAGVGDGVSGKADGVVWQRRTPVGRSSVGQSVVGSGIGNDSSRPGRNGGDWEMSGGVWGLSHNSGGYPSIEYGVAPYPLVPKRNSRRRETTGW